MTHEHINFYNNYHNYLIVPPLLIVGISAAVIYEQYGTSEYCWISTANPKSGAIWAFALPMLVIIIINTFFLLAALRSVYKVSKEKMTKKKKYSDGKSANNQALFKQLFIATIVLLPLLGSTWVFGLLSVNRSTTFFAWMFTILNSLQGLFIFIFHVLKSEKVWGKLKLCKKKTEQSKSAGSTARTAGGHRESNQFGNTRQLSVSQAEPKIMMVNKTALKAEEKTAIKEERVGDTDLLIDVNLDMFSTGEEEEEKVEEKEEKEDNPEKGV